MVRSWSAGTADTIETRRAFCGSSCCCGLAAPHSVLSTASSSKVGLARGSARQQRAQISGKGAAVAADSTGRKGGFRLRSVTLPST